MGMAADTTNKMHHVHQNDAFSWSNQECLTSLGEEKQALYLKQIEDPNCQIIINNKKLALDELIIDNCKSNGKALF